LLWGCGAVVLLRKWALEVWWRVVIGLGELDELGELSELSELLELLEFPKHTSDINHTSRSTPSNQSLPQQRNDVFKLPHPL
jgi:hypothetical protein